MKPRHLKNQTLIQFQTVKDSKSNSNQKKREKSKVQNILNINNQYSSLIPFHNTEEYNEFIEWIHNWSQSQPACILFGPISCGKSRIIQQAASKLLCHIIEIDCASISGIKELVSTFHESTQSRSVGIFLNHDNSNYDDAISMVVLEHIDSIISLNSPPPNSIINLISKSLVPLVMTSQSLCIQPDKWVKVIPVKCFSDPFSILKTADWLKDSINELSTNQAIHSLLSFTDQDIRQTSLQYQVWKNNSNSILSRDRQIYLSIPLCVQQKSNPKDKREFYADICDLFISVNHDDQIFDSYIRPISEDFRSHKREQLFEDYVSFANVRIRHTNDSLIDRLELTDIVYQACLNDQSFTRNTSKPSLPTGHKIKANEIQYVKSWNLWPYSGRDLSNDEEIQNPVNNNTQNELKIENEVKTEYELKIENKENTENECDMNNENEPKVEKNEENIPQPKPQPQPVPEPQPQPVPLPKPEETKTPKKRGRKKKTDGLKQKKLV